MAGNDHLHPSTKPYAVDGQDDDVQVGEASGIAQKCFSSANPSKAMKPSKSKREKGENSLRSFFRKCKRKRRKEAKSRGVIEKWKSYSLLRGSRLNPDHGHHRAHLSIASTTSPERRPAIDTAPIALPRTARPAQRSVPSEFAYIVGNLIVRRTVKVEVSLRIFVLKRQFYRNIERTLASEVLVL
jgi:hypothetical protein